MNQKYVTCTDNEAFEDQLSTDRLYKLYAFSRQSVMVENDRGVLKYYGWDKFKLENMK